MEIRFADKLDRNMIDEITRAFSENKYAHSDAFFDEAISGERLFIATKKDSSSGIKPVGYLVYQVLWGNTPFLALVRVMPEFQGSGVGSALLEKFENKLRKDGFDSYLSSSEQVNEGAQFFHEKKGFERIGELNMLFGKEVFFRKNI